MITLFLATVIGWYLVIVSLFLLLRRDLINSMMSEILAARGIVFAFAIITLILGLLMVVSHNIWVMGWPVIVTLLSWLVLISGILRLYFPDTAIKMGKDFLAHPYRMTIAAMVFLLIGLFLLFKVYLG